MNIKSLLLVVVFSFGLIGNKTVQAIDSQEIIATIGLATGVTGTIVAGIILYGILKTDKSKKLKERKKSIAKSKPYYYAASATVVASIALVLISSQYLNE